MTVAAQPVVEPPLPHIHWLLVLVLGVATLGVFTSIWAIVQARWIRRIDPGSKALAWIWLHWALSLVSGLASLAPGLQTLEVVSGIAAVVLYLSAYFSMKNSLQTYINRVTNGQVSLSGRMTAFFTAAYLQFKMNALERAQQSLIPLADTIG